MNHKLLTAIALASISLNAFSGELGTPGEVSLWQNPVGLHLGITGGYFQPTASGDDLAYGYPQTPGVLTNAVSQMRQIDPDYSGAIGANISYTFANLFDIGFNYLYFSSSKDRDTTRFTSGQTFTIENPNTDNLVAAPSEVTGAAHYRINQFDLSGGQTFIFDKISLHPTAILRFTELNRYLNTNAVLNGDSVTDAVSGNTFSSNVVNQITEKSHFNGVGPLLGIDGSYHFMYGFEVIGHIDGGLLLGTINTRNLQFSTGNGQLGGMGQPISAFSSWSEVSTHRIVPVANLRLGAAYQFAVGQRTNARIEAGWNASEYWESVDRTFANGAGTANGNFIANINGATTTSSFGFTGPYANLTLSIA